jgi:hypothetical protein
MNVAAKLAEIDLTNLDPIQKLVAVEQVRAWADDREAEAYTEALELHRWLIGPTARYVGMPTTSLQRLLTTGRLADLYATVLEQRHAEGWRPGKTLPDLAAGSRKPAKASKSKGSTPEKP